MYHGYCNYGHLHDPGIKNFPTLTQAGYNKHVRKKVMDDKKKSITLYQRCEIWARLIADLAVLIGIIVLLQR
jgi:hypothetical protein